MSKARKQKKILGLQNWWNLIYLKYFERFDVKIQLRAKKKLQFDLLEKGKKEF